jgi:RNA polymerase sigma-70 factor, ECF subfamily
MLSLNLKDVASKCDRRKPVLPSGDRPAAEASQADTSVLVREAQRGNTAAFEELVRQYDKAALRLALRVTGSEHDAQDVCQEAFLGAYQNLQSFRFECSFYTWLYRIVMNRCLDYLRRRRNPHETVVVSKASRDSGEGEVLGRLADRRSASNPETKLAAREIRTRITRALEKLTPCERAVFELKHYQHLKLRAVAVALNTSEGNARHALFRARQKLRVALAEVR